MQLEPSVVGVTCVLLFTKGVMPGALVGWSADAAAPAVQLPQQLQLLRPLGMHPLLPSRPEQSHHAL